MRRLLIAAFSILLFSVFLGSLSTVGCSDHYYYKEATEYVNLVDSLLVKNEVCSDLKSCDNTFFSSDGWRFMGKENGGVTITIYSVGDTNLIENIFSEVKSYYSTHRAVPVSVYVYNVSHDEVIKSSDHKYVSKLILGER